MFVTDLFLANFNLFFGTYHNPPPLGSLHPSPRLDEVTSWFPPHLSLLPSVGAQPTLVRNYMLICLGTP